MMPAVTSPFTAGYADGLHNRPNLADEQEAGRPREKYVDGYAIGVQDREAGALDPMEPLS